MFLISQPAINTILVLLALLLIAVAFIWLNTRRRKDKNLAFEEKTADALTSLKEKENEEEKQEGRELTVHQMSTDLKALKDRQDIIDTHVIPLAALYQSLLMAKLTHFHTPVLDALMKKAEATPGQISPEEEARMLALLEERKRDMGPEISDDERDAAEALPIMLRMVRREAEALAKGARYTSVKVVGILYEGE
jgi:hypothetical protein